MSRPKDIGTAAETAVVRWLRNNGWPQAERRALRGTDDAGDITGTIGLAWEIKAGQAAHTASDQQIEQWMRETETERENAGAEFGFLILRRKGKGDPGQWWAWVWLADLMAIASAYRHPRVSPFPAGDPPVRVTLAHLVTELRAAGYGEPEPLTEGTSA